MFTLVWTEYALHDLADMWHAADAALQVRIEAALQELEAAVRQDPDQVGESRDAETRRIAFSTPVVIVFQIDRPALTVRVNHTRLYGR